VTISRRIDADVYDRGPVTFSLEVEGFWFKPSSWCKSCPYLFSSIHKQFLSIHSEFIVVCSYVVTGEAS
jgi:hypothetical protein